LIPSSSSPAGRPTTAGAHSLPASKDRFLAHRAGRAYQRWRGRRTYAVGAAWRACGGRWRGVLTNRRRLSDAPPCPAEPRPFSTSRAGGHSAGDTIRASWSRATCQSISARLTSAATSAATFVSESGRFCLFAVLNVRRRNARQISESTGRTMVTPAGFEPAISTLKGSRPWPG
jgi:hypothetical protein